MAYRAGLQRFVRQGIVTFAVAASCGAHAGFLDSFGAGTTKVKIAAVRPPEIAEVLQFRSIAIGSVSGPGADIVAGDLESLLVSARLRDRPLFDSVVRGKNAATDAVITVDITTSNVKDEKSSEPRTECTKYQKAAANANLLKSLLTMTQCEPGYSRNYSVDCITRRADFVASVRIARARGGQIVFADSIASKAEDKACGNEGKAVADGAALLAGAEKAFMDRLRALVVPATLQMEVDLMAPDDAVSGEAERKRFDGALRFAEEGRLDRACEMLRELSEKYGRTSLALSYDLGVCEEAEGNAWAAEEQFKKADRLTGEPSKLITEALARSRAAVSQAAAQGRQAPVAVAAKPSTPNVASPPGMASPPVAGGIISAENLLEDKRVALVIGNGGYRNVGALPNAVNDAQDIAAELKKLHFDVILRTNANWEGMDQAITEFTRRLKPSGVSLFYYAGHGAQVKDQNYILPIDMDLRSVTPDMDKDAKERLLQRQTISLNSLMSRLGDSKSAFNIVILDACRDDPIEQKSRSLRKTRGAGEAAIGGLARMDAPKGSYIAYSTQPGNVASDGAEGSRNSPFAEGLIAALRVPNLKLEDVMKRTRSHVDRTTAHQQLPWDNSSLVGDFFFSASQPVAATGAPSIAERNAAQATSLASRSVQPTESAAASKSVPPAQAVAAKQEPPAAAAPGVVQSIVATDRPKEKGPQEFCADRPNFISRGICESRKCKESAWQNDPYCEKFKSRDL